MKKIYYNRLDEHVLISNKEFDKLITYIHSLEIEIEQLKKYEKFIERTIITPENWNIDTGRYVLYGNKQELYKRLYELREEIHEEWRKRERAK